MNKESRNYVYDVDIILNLMNFFNLLIIINKQGNNIL